MSGAVYLAAGVGMAVVLSTLLWIVQRRPRSVLTGIDEFRRGMDALGRGAPAERARRRNRRAGAAGDRPDPIVPARGSGDLARKLRAARQHGAQDGRSPGGGRNRDRRG